MSCYGLQTTFVQTVGVRSAQCHPCAYQLLKFELSILSAHKVQTLVKGSGVRALKNSLLPVYASQISCEIMRIRDCKKGVSPRLHNIFAKFTGNYFLLGDIISFPRKKFLSKEIILCKMNEFFRKKIFLWQEKIFCLNT